MISPPELSKKTVAKSSCLFKWTKQVIKQNSDIFFYLDRMLSKFKRNAFC